MLVPLPISWRRLAPLSLLGLALALGACAVHPTLGAPWPTPTFIPTTVVTPMPTRQIIPLGTPLTGHTGRLWAVAYSPDGKTLASAGEDKTICLWEVSNPRAAAPMGEPLRAHTNWVVALAFSPDSRLLASGSWDSSVILWDTSDPYAARQIGAPLSGHTRSVYAVAFGPDGRLLASAGADKTIRLWDVADPHQPVPLGKPLIGALAHVNAIAFSSDGRILVAASCGQLEKPVVKEADYGCAAGEVLLWNITDPSRPVRMGTPILAHSKAISYLAFGPAGRTLASAGGDHALLWDLSDPLAPRQLGAPLRHPDLVNGLAFAPHSQTLASGSCGRKDARNHCIEGTILFWELSNPAAPQLLAGPLAAHDNWITALAFSPDSRTLASAGWDGKVKLWAMPIGEGE